ncbi:MAG: ROK family protein, partial [Myxococcota bacterium]
MNSLLTAQYNTSRVLRQLWLEPGVSRAEIADRLGLNRSTLTHIIKSLGQQGLVRELDGGATGPLGGRRNVRLSLNPDFGCFAGLDVREDVTRIVGLNVTGDVIFRKDIKVRATGRKLYGAVEKAYRWLRSETERQDLSLLGVGLGVAGVVDHEARVLVQSNPLEVMEPLHLGEELSQHISEPVLVDNDANCCCWGEIMARRKSEPSSFLFVFGTWRKVRTPAPLHLTSIGMGIAIEDSVHRGRHCSAGEFRSIKWKPGRHSQFSFSDEEISAAYSDRRSFLKIVRELARNTALLVNVLDLDDLYLAGFLEDGEADM